MKRINLALQGGGAHGAFTWGVLDRILEDDRIEIAAISGTSAGAMNGAALKAGMIEGRRDGARANLNWFWEQIGAVKDENLSGWMDTVSPNHKISVGSDVLFAGLCGDGHDIAPYVALWVRPVLQQRLGTHRGADEIRRDLL